MKIFMFVCVVIALTLNFSFAQGNQVSIQLLDETLHAPIVGAAYRLGSRIGTSDSEGKIRFILNETDTLHLSHISYGDWFLTKADLANAINTGCIYREQEIFTLQPVTVIALRPKQTGSEHLGLDIRDRLSHDAGSILNQSPVINSIRRGGGYGFDPVLRGFKYEQLNVVIDGAHGAIAACPNRMDPPTSQIAPNMMERVDIYKGPHSFRYGTAFGGTINFESAALHFSPQQEFYGRFSGSSESNGGIYRSEGVAGLSFENYDISVFGSWSKGSDYNDGDDNSVPSGFERVSIGSWVSCFRTANN